MKPARHRSIAPVAAVALTACLASCHHPDSILLVEVAGDLALMPASFVVTVTPGQMPGKIIRVMPGGGGTISLPASFTIQLPGSVTGPITVMVQALDAYSTMIATGTATQQDLNIGGQTILVVTIVAPGGVTPPPVDAGSPADAGDAAVDAGPTSDGAVDAREGDAAGSDAARRSDASADVRRARDAGGDK